MSKWKCVVFGTALLAAASISHAAIVTWNLQNVTFGDGTASGFFTLDSTNAVNESISMPPGSCTSNKFASSGRARVNAAATRPMIAHR